MSFWRVERFDSDSYLIGVHNFDSYNEAMAFAKWQVRHFGMRTTDHCCVVKCGGTPLQCCIDGTQAHYVY